MVYLGHYQYGSGLEFQDNESSQFYSLQSSAGDVITLTEAKAYMRVSQDREDTIITAMIAACVEWGEKYTGRSFRVNTWELLQDCFTYPIVLKAGDVESVTSVSHIVNGSFAAVDTDDYYLKKGNLCSNILTPANISWPSNTDDRLQAIRIVFVTRPVNCIEVVKQAILQHVNYWFHNRGDCSCETAATGSNVKATYSTIAAPRF